MRFLIMLEQIETGFSVQAPDLAIATSYGENIEAASRAASEAIRINLAGVSYGDSPLHPQMYSTKRVVA